MGIGSTLYLSLSVSFFCKSASWSLSSPDTKLSENIWFVWSRASYSVGKWRCYHAGQTTTEDRATQLMDTERWVSQCKTCIYPLE